MCWEGATGLWLALGSRATKMWPPKQRGEAASDQGKGSTIWGRIAHEQSEDGLHCWAPEPFRLSEMPGEDVHTRRTALGFGIMPAGWGSGDFLLPGRSRLHLLQLTACPQPALPR